MNDDKIYMIRKIFVMLTCILVFVTLGLVVVKFQTKEVTIDYYGKVEHIKTMSNTVEGLLMQNNIHIDENAIVTPGMNDRLENDMVIKIYSEDEVAYLDIDSYIEMAKSNVVEKIVEEIQYIDYAKEEKSNASMTRGTTKVIQEGQQGEKTSTYVIKYENEKEVARKLISEEISKEAVSEITDVGTALPTVSRSSTTSKVNSSDLVASAGFKEYNISFSKEYQIYAYNMASKYGIEYELFLAMMYVESGFNPNKISRTNDYGLCQINISNHANLSKKLGITNFLDPYQNMQAGAYFLARYFTSWGKSVSDKATLELHALNSYNRGDASYKKYLRAGNSATSWYYGNKVVAARDTLLQTGHF